MPQKTSWTSNIYHWNNVTPWAELWPPGLPALSMLCCVCRFDYGCWLRSSYHTKNHGGSTKGETTEKLRLSAPCLLVSIGAFQWECVTTWRALKCTEAWHVFAVATHCALLGDLVMSRFLCCVATLLTTQTNEEVPADEMGHTKKSWSLDRSWKFSSSTNYIPVVSRLLLDFVG